MLMKGQWPWVVQSLLDSNQKLEMSWSNKNSEKYRIDEFFIRPIQDLFIYTIVYFLIPETTFSLVLK